MNKKELEFILQQGEGQYTEFKESFDKSLAKEIVAFANANGGRIFLGVDDKNRIFGCKLTNKLKSRIINIAHNCDPKIEISVSSFDNIVIIGVKESDNKLHKCSFGFYMRKGSNSQKMTRDEIMDFAVGERKIRFDNQINANFKFPQDFDEKKFLEFLKRSNISKVIPIKEILINLSLGIIVKRKFRLNNAGILLFAKEPERFFRQNFVTCVLYKGRDKVNIIDRKDFKNDLLNNYENTFAFLKQHLRLEYEIKGYGPRKEIPEIPYEALRESLINALIHRDYAQKSEGFLAHQKSSISKCFEDRFGIFVEIFDDRVEITNKGKLLFDKRQLGKISMPRNPIIFDIFHRFGLIEKVGSGINRIKKQVKERGLKVKFEVDEFFRIILYKPKIAETGVKTRVKTRVKIIKIIKENPSVTTPEIAKETGLSIKGVEWNLTRMKEDGLLKRIGPAKGGHWEVVGK